MALWDKITSRGSVDDRRSAAGYSGLGITGVVLLMGATYLLGGNPLEILIQQAPALQQSLTKQDVTKFEGKDSYEVFVSQVLGSTNDAWKNIFSTVHKEYIPTQVVLFRNNTQSKCGGASAVVGPHYCPLDEKIYLDETFFTELHDRLGAKGGDVAEAYVIAHEVGHHVQHQLGILGTEPIIKSQSVAIELEADCFAGLWAYSIKDAGVFEFGEVNEALDAAAAVGDDRIQQRTQGKIQPESWTHGSSAQRVDAFTKGYTNGSFDACLAYTTKS